MRLRRPTATEIVLALLCAMYLITYVDRVNIATAASSIRRDLSLSNTQLGFIFSAFAYPYLFFQIFGGWMA
jgi:sugar phosphate permease